MSVIGVVVNPRAGRNRGVHDRAWRLGSVLGADGWVREPRTLEHLADVAVECRERGVEIVGVCGGDGTLARTLSALVRAYGSERLPGIVPLRAGTMNTVARAVGAPRWQPERLLAEVVDGCKRGRRLDASEYQLLEVNGRDYGFMVGVGVPVEFLRLYYDRPRQGARAAAGLLFTLAGSVMSGGALVRKLFEPRAATLVCDGERVPFDAFSVIYASTIEDIGLGFRPTYRARERPGYMHVFAGPIGAAELLRCLPNMRRGQPTGAPRVYDALARTLSLELERPTQFMIDGDLMDPVARIAVRHGPVVRVIRR